MRVGEVSDPERIEGLLGDHPIHNIRALTPQQINGDEPLIDRLHPAHALAVFCPAVFDPVGLHASQISKRTRSVDFLAGGIAMSMRETDRCEIDAKETLMTLNESEDALNAVPWPLVTERLTVRRVRDDDVEHTWRYRRLPEVGDYISWWSDSFEEYRRHQWDDKRRRLMLTIEHTDTAAVIGDVMLKIQDGWAQAGMESHARGTEAELGWSLDPAFGGHGYATEAVREVIDACFTHLKLRRVSAGCFADNEPSWRLMERVGMRREEYSRKTGLHRSGVWLDGMLYGLLAEEWQANDHSR